MREVWVYDLEVWQNFHSGTFLNPVTGEVKQYYIHGKINQLEEYINFLETRVSGLIGFNNVGYDYPIIHHILLNKRRLLQLSEYDLTKEIHEKSVAIINEEYSAIRASEVLIPQLDLYLIWHFNNKNKRTSLKYIEINTRFENVEDLPFDEDYYVMTEDIPSIMEYNLNDVKATEKFYHLSKDDIEMRKKLRKQFGFSIDFLNYNDPKIGEQIFGREVAKEMGISMWDLKKMKTYRSAISLKDVILPNIKFKTPEFNKLLNKFKNSVVTDTKKPFEYSVIYKGFKYDYGVGGIHGCIESGVYDADNEYDIIDIDIDGMYPSTAIIYGFYPEHLGETFTKVYKRLYDTRIKAKRAYKLDKSNKEAAAINSGLKLSLNGVYGKSNDQFSFLYDPMYTMKITVNGQLLLSMLAERIADIDNLTMLQANTDGITVKLPKTKKEEFLSICKQWEEETGYTLEYGYYSRMVIRDVNNYIAKYIDGEYKHKGAFEIIPKQNGKVAYHKNWSMRIVPIALEKYYMEGIPIEETIRNHDDIYDFCLAKKFPKPWRGEYTTIINGQKHLDVFEKNIRYYISTKGSYLWKVNTEDGRESQINVGFLVQPFNKYENKEEYNINYNFYIAEARKIILSIEDGQMKLF